MMLKILHSIFIQSTNAVLPHLALFPLKISIPPSRTRAFLFKLYKWRRIECLEGIIFLVINYKRLVCGSRNKRYFVCHCTATTLPQLTDWLWVMTEWSRLLQLSDYLFHSTCMRPILFLFAETSESILLKLFTYDFYWDFHSGQPWTYFITWGNKVTLV